MAAFLRGSRLSEDELNKRLRAEVGEEIKLNLDAVRGLSDDIYAGRYKPEELGEEGAGRRIELWVGTLGMMYARGSCTGRTIQNIAGKPAQPNIAKPVPV